ncbi:hypothetical protein TSMEX_011565 [Taenia solium]|eukprot:TsM_000539400 transcript=TsM_000539400 gene=TsM_000539400
MFPKNLKENKRHKPILVLPIITVQIFGIEMKKIETDRDQLARRTLELKERLFAHEESRVERNNRIQNALKKFQLEKARTKNIQKEISNLKGNYSLLLALKSKKERSLRYFTQFFTFINSAVQYSEEFNDINDLISRAEALKSLHLAKTEHLLEGYNNLIAMEKEHNESYVKNFNRTEQIFAKEKAYIMNHIIDLEQVNKLLLQEQH